MSRMNEYASSPYHGYGWWTHKAVDLRKTHMYRHITFLNPGAQVWQFTESFLGDRELVSLEKYLTLRIIDEGALDITKELCEKLLRAPDWIYAIHIENMVNVKSVSLRHESDEFPSENGIGWSQQIEPNVTSVGVPFAFPEDIPEIVFVKFKGNGGKTLSTIPTIGYYESASNWTVVLEPCDEGKHATADVKVSIGYVNPFGFLQSNNRKLKDAPRPTYFVNGKEYTAKVNAAKEEDGEHVVSK